MILTAPIENPEMGQEIINLEQLQAVLHRYCLSITGSSWDAEDLSQETWLKAVGKLRGSNHKCPEALLKRIAKNTWIDQLRRKKLMTRILLQEQPEVSPQDNGLFEIERIFQTLDNNMSPLQRTVFLLREVIGLSIGETAERLETTVGAVKAALHRARMTLEAVKDDLADEALRLPEEESKKVFLRELAVAYRIGDIPSLVKLSLQGEVIPETMVRIVKGRRIQAKTLTVPRTITPPLLRIAA